MSTVQNILNVNTLFLTWQSNQDRNKRYFVGEVKRVGTKVTFNYSVGTADYEEAIKEGFTGYPAFKLNKSTFENDIIPTFMKRLPPRSRRDFVKYLKNYQLSESFVGSDFDLIAHTDIQLPSDGFGLIPNLLESTIPFDYIMEVVGTRYNISYEEFSNLNIGDEIELVEDVDNKSDSQAVALYVNSMKVGYVNKLLCKSIKALMLTQCLTSVISKLSGTKERPLIYTMLSAKEL